MDHLGGHIHANWRLPITFLRGVSCFLALCLWGIVLAACQREVILADQATNTPLVPASGDELGMATSSPPIVLLSSTPLPQPLSPLTTPTVTQLPCWQAGGRIEQTELSVSYLPHPFQFRVYVPPCYDTLTNRRYPVLYLIHGQFFNHDQWERLGAPELVDRLSASGELPPFMIVMPRDQRWTEPGDDRFGQALIEVLVPYIDANYRSLPQRENRAVGGLSRGGAWALHLGVTNWELFGAIGMHSGFVFQSDVGYIKHWLDDIPVQQIPRFYMDIGDDDRPEIAKSAAYFERLLTERGIAHEWYMFPGEHEEAYWQSHVEQYLRWYAQAWE